MRPKDKGTRRETKLVNELGAAGIPARRAENHAPGRDVDLRTGPLRIVEVKDRQQLNIHKTLAATLRNHPGHLAGVVWHRTSKADGAKRASPDGPTVWALPVNDAIDLFCVERAAWRLLDAVARHAPDLIEHLPREVEQAYVDLENACQDVTAYAPASKDEL